jgi:pyridoxal phosphate enzyme (YggS family)
MADGRDASPPPPASPEDPSQAATDGRASLRVRHAAVLERIAAAARGCGRDPASVALLAVSKTFDAGAVLALADCGQRDFGENYVQEALTKRTEVGDRWPLRPAGRTGRSELPELPDEVPDLPVWHFIGPLQSNKTRPIAESFDWVHSVDREKVARRLSEQRPASLAPLQVCIQVDVSGEATKSGCVPEDLPALARLIAGLPGLRLRGLMAIPAPTDDPVLQRAQFARVREVFDRLQAEGLPVDTLSMGMSADLEAAIAEGATIVRVGTAVFGERPKKEAVG